MFHKKCVVFFATTSGYLVVRLVFGLAKSQRPTPVSAPVYTLLNLHPLTPCVDEVDAAARPHYCQQSYQ